MLRPSELVRAHEEAEVSNGETRQSVVSYWSVKRSSLFGVYSSFYRGRGVV